MIDQSSLRVQTKSSLTDIKCAYLVEAESFSVEEKLMPLAADPYASNNAAGFSGKPFVYFYNGLNEINLRFDVTYIKTGEPNIASECYEFCVDEMSIIAKEYVLRDDDETDDIINNQECKEIWYEIRKDSIWDDYREDGYDSYSQLVDDMFDYIANVARDLKINLILNQMDEMKLVFADWVFFENWAYEEFWDF